MTIIDEQGTEAKRKDVRALRGPVKLFHRFDYFESAEEEYQWVKERFPNDCDACKCSNRGHG